MSTNKVMSEEVKEINNTENNIKEVKQEPEFLGKMGIQELAKKELESLVYMENVKDILAVSQATGENLILYGPGGYGKSDASLAFFKSQGIEPYIITMGSGMTIDRLFGGLDIPAFNSTGRLEYLIENSFMNHENVIFEELFDAPDFILEQLKDILSSGIFRNGTQIFPIKTKMIVCCTNKTREEFSKNNSLKALMERFPLETKVIWKDHTRITYENLLKKRFGNADPMLTYLLEQFAIAGNIISPRIAIKAALILEKCGPKALTHIADFNAKPELLKTSVQKFESLAKISNLIKSMADTVAEYAKTDRTTLSGVKEATKINNTLSKLIKEMQAIKADDSMVSTHTNAIKTYTYIQVQNAKDIKIELLVDDEDSSGVEQAVVAPDQLSDETNPF